ncbi:MAG: ADP-ribose-binding protein [Geobacteraceae bacterium]|nr:ADP-ribose-binding protein [Geobacteraceae bacterium]
MNNITGNLWDHYGRAIIAVTTNGLVTKTGKALLGNGCARQAGEQFPDLAQRLGTILAKQGNHVAYLGDGVVSFPVEHSPYETPDLKLIERSARELASLADSMGWEKVVVPRPGCGGGGLSWKEVKPIIEKYFDDRFLIITR